MVDQVVMLLVSGVSGVTAIDFCAKKGETIERAREIVAEARKKLTIAASFNRDEQLGKAIARLEDLYAKSIAAKPADVRSAIQAQKELNKLLNLHARPSLEVGANEGDSDDARRLSLISTYLTPLKLLDDKYPLEEHARVAAEMIRASRVSGE